MDALAFVILLALVLDPVISSVHMSIPVSTSGSVSAGAYVVYMTGFENATTNVRGFYLNLDPDLIYSFPLSNYISQGNPVNGPGRQWVDPIERPSDLVSPFPSNFIARPGSDRCLAIYFPPTTIRSNFALWTVRTDATDAETGPDNPQPNITGNEFYISEWLFVPDFNLASPSDQWYSLYQISNIGPAYPFYGFQILGNTNHPWWADPGTYTAVLAYRNAAGALSYLASYRNFQNVLPIGRWFKFVVYMLRHPTNGVYKAWVDGIKIFDVSGLDTTTPSTAYYPYGAYSLDTCVYLQSDDPNPHWLFIDDIQIWSSLPSS